MVDGATAASFLTADERRIRAAFYRHLAKSASTAERMDELILLADHYERLVQGPCDGEMLLTTHDSSAAASGE